MEEVAAPDAAQSGGRGGRGGICLTDRGTGGESATGEDEGQQSGGENENESDVCHTMTPLFSARLPNEPPRTSLSLPHSRSRVRSPRGGRPRVRDRSVPFRPKKRGGARGIWSSAHGHGPSVSAEKRSERDRSVSSMPKKRGSTEFIPD